MLGIGMQEILLIFVVALIFIGPKRLPELAKTLGKGFSEFKRATDNIQETVRKDLELERHEELKKKYPGLVPDEEPGAASSAEAASPPPAEESAPGSSPSEPYAKTEKPGPPGGSACGASAPKDNLDE